MSHLNKWLGYDLAIVSGHGHQPFMVKVEVEHAHDRPECEMNEADLKDIVLKIIKELPIKKVD